MTGAPATMDYEILESSILIVDDNPTNVELVRQMLSYRGYRHINVETDSRNVFDRCRSKTFDIVLLDIRMPHLNGFHVMEGLSEIFADDHVPILVLTAQADQDTRRAALEAGATDFLTKPFVVWELLQRVNNMLQIRHLYRQVRSQNRDLEDRVAERTRELTAALAASRKADQAKLDFLTMMSHELRTPLNAIIGFAEEIQADLVRLSVAPECREYASLIEDNGRGLLTTVNRILDYIRGTTGALALEETTVNLHTLLTDCVTVAEGPARSKGITIACSDGPTLQVAADAERLRIALLSIIDNAIKFNRPGGSVTVNLEPGADALAIAVADDGPGIDSALTGELFDLFVQGDRNALTRRHGGIGLGLPIARRFMELHGGSVALATGPNGGTVVRLILPGARRLGTSTAVPAEGAN